MIIVWNNYCQKLTIKMIYGMRKYLGVFMLLASQLSVAQFDPEAKAILDAMRDNYRNIEAFTATFTQKLTNESAGLEEQFEGTITVMDKFYKLIIGEREIYYDGTDLWSYNKDISEVTVSPYMEDEQEISLNNIWDIYQEGFKYILLSTNPNGNQVIDLDPIDRDGSYFKIRMIISRENRISSFTVFENTGNKYLYEITNFKEQADLTPDFFKFDPEDYEGIEVLDFR